jgi:hypothetical protein
MYHSKGMRRLEEVVRLIRNSTREVQHAKNVYRSYQDICKHYEFAGKVVLELGASGFVGGFFAGARGIGVV